MNISNATEFRNFVTGNQLQGLHPTIDAAVLCIIGYEQTYSCCFRGDQKAVETNCNNLYQSAVGFVMTSYKAHFLQHVPDSGITFSLHGKIIGILRR